MVRRFPTGAAYRKQGEFVFQQHQEKSQKWKSKKHTSQFLQQELGNQVSIDKAVLR